MLTSIVATDRDNVSVMRHETEHMKWLSLSLTKSSGDFGRVELSISTEVAQRLVEGLLLELAQIKAPEAERLANQRAAQAAALRAQILAEISEDIAVLSGHAWTGTDCEAVADAIWAGDIRHVRIVS